MLRLNGLFADGGQVKATPGILVLRAATGIYSDGLSGLDYGRILSLFHEE